VEGSEMPTPKGNGRDVMYVCCGRVLLILVLYYDGRCGVVVGILVYYAIDRGFDARTVQTFVCMNMSVYIGSGCFYV
jgi:hypothetical protein